MRHKTFTREEKQTTGPLRRTVFLYNRLVYAVFEELAYTRAMLSEKDGKSSRDFAVAPLIREAMHDFIVKEIDTQTKNKTLSKETAGKFKLYLETMGSLTHCDKNYFIEN